MFIYIFACFLYVLIINNFIYGMMRENEGKKAMKP